MLFICCLFCVPSMLWHLPWLPFEVPFVASLSRLRGFGFGPVVDWFSLSPVGRAHS